MRFSLVLATVDRTYELGRFLYHLDQQSCRDFELIIVDQNTEDILLPVLEPYSDSFPLIHLRSLQRGVSRARNLGIKYARGEIIGFPDDDCWYHPDCLDNISKFFARHRKWDGLSGCTINSAGIHSLSRYDARAGEINSFNIWCRTTASSLFLRKYVVESVAGFNEELGGGSGTPFGSSEDIDYPLQAIKKGFKIFYNPEFKVYHPDPYSCLEEKAFKRVYFYGIGMGRVLRKHQYPFWFLLYYLARALGGLTIGIVSGNSAKIKYHFLSFKGRVYGWKYPDKCTSAGEI
ncbi:MAG: glycosyltransferase [Syntrophomonas sp.]